MCCRYWTDRTAETEEIVERMNRSPLAERLREGGEIRAYGEMRPSDIVPVIASNRSGLRSVFPMKWGFSGRSLLINARSETAFEKPMFRSSWAFRRCVIPASYYFEWEHIAERDGRKRTGEKYRIAPKEGGLTRLCGLYRMEADLPVFVILTRGPGEDIRFIHDRMPLILPEDAAREWIRPDAKPEELIREAITAVTYEKIKEHPDRDIQLSMF